MHIHQRQRGFDPAGRCLKLWLWKIRKDPYARVLHPCVPVANGACERLDADSLMFHFPHVSGKMRRTQEFSTVVAPMSMIVCTIETGRCESFCSAENSDRILTFLVLNYLSFSNSLTPIFVPKPLSNGDNFRQGSPLILNKKLGHLTFQQIR
jgi:hypothetical protein